MGNRLQQGMHFWPTLLVVNNFYIFLGPKIPLSRTVSHPTLVSDEVPLGVPSVQSLKCQAPVFPEVLPMGKKLWRTQRVGAPVSPNIPPIGKKSWLTERVRAPVSPDVLPIGTNLRPTPGVSSTPLPLHPSSYCLAVYDSTNPVVESTYINYTRLLGSFILRSGVRGR